LIIAPTRELALQVQRELTWLYAETGARVIACVGGMDVRAEARQLAAGAHIVVGTPGRLRDHLERQRLDLTKLRSIVLDEADEMLDLGFREDLEFILEATPASRQTLLFSATMPREIETLARRYQRDAMRIETINRNEQHTDIDYRAVRVAAYDVENAVVNVLRFHEARATLVFCATREAVKRLHSRLVERGFSAVALSGELTQSERTQALQALRDGRARVLVATDVAARGLDLPDLALVIHADLPNDRETLLHRSGRTGRAGKKGLCMLIVPYNKRRKAEALIGAARLRVTWEAPPTAEDVRAQDQTRFLADSAFTDASTDEDIALARTLQAGRSADEIALALVRLYRARLPAPEDLAPDTGPPRGDNRRPENRERFERRPDRVPRERASRDRASSEDTGDRRPPRAPRPSRDRQAMVWFRLTIGRERNADPRWLLPIICQAGGVTKAEVGAIKIFDRDTRFEIAEASADRFAEAVRANKPKEGHITRVDASAPADRDPIEAVSAPKPQRDGASQHATPARVERSHDRHKAPWRERSEKAGDDRSKTEAGGRPYRKGFGKGAAGKDSQGHKAYSRPKPAGTGGPKSASKFAHKKKHRPQPSPAKS
jgi:ATP-dependent RNA helicase DeaD